MFLLMVMYDGYVLRVWYLQENITLVIIVCFWRINISNLAMRRTKFRRIYAVLYKMPDAP